MDLHLHTGAHCTDQDRLVKCMLRNLDSFRAHGIAVPGPSRYRQLLSATMNALGKGAPAPDAREVVLDAILDQEPGQVQRLVLSHENFFCVPKIAVARGHLYPMAVNRLQNLARLFEGDRIRIFLGIRNPATFLPAVYAESPQTGFDAFLNGSAPTELRWGEFIARLCDEVPGIALTVWCNEDTPVIWGRLIREMAGLPEGHAVTGAHDLLAAIMTPEGMTRMRAYLARHPALTEAQQQRVAIAFLDKYAIADAIEEELDVPGWTDDLVAELTAAYEADVTMIEAMPQVRFLAP